MMRSSPDCRDLDSLNFCRRVPTDTRGVNIIPQIPFLRYAHVEKSFLPILARGAKPNQAISYDIKKGCCVTKKLLTMRSCTD